MTGSAVLGGVAGTLLGLRQIKVWALLPAILLVAGGVILYGLVDGQNVRTVTLNSLRAVVSLEVGYLLGVIAGEYLPIRGSDRKPELFRIVQAAIGRELRIAFELPRELTPGMAAMLQDWDQRHLSFSTDHLEKLA